MRPQCEYELTKDEVYHILNALGEYDLSEGNKGITDLQWKFIRSKQIKITGDVN